MSSPLQDESFDVLHELLNEKTCFFFHIFTDPADAEFSAAILVNIAVIAEKTPSGLLMSKVSRNQNKCQNSFPKKYVRALWAGPGLINMVVPIKAAVKYYP